MWQLPVLLVGGAIAWWKRDAIKSALTKHSYENPKPNPTPQPKVSDDTITSSQKTLVKFFASPDGDGAKVYHNNTPVSYTTANVTGILDQTTKDALAIFQAWYDDHTAKPTIHIPDVNGNWSEYGTLDKPTLAALTAWSAQR